MVVIGALALSLQACVSYYSSPYETIRPTEYYADNEEYQDAIDEYAPDVYMHDVAGGGNISFADAVYYPWWSVDYFYLGPHYYRPGYWPGPRSSLGYRYGFPPNYWTYYVFYSPFYYPNATYALYDPWTGWPRYGIGTSYFWQEARWATRNAQSRTAERVRSDNSYGNSLYENYDRYGDAFSDSANRADRAPTISAPRGSLSTTPGTRTGSMQVRNRTDVKIRESRTGTTPIARPPSRPLTRPTISTPRPSSIPRTSSGSEAPAYQLGKKRKN